MDSFLKVIDTLLAHQYTLHRHLRYFLCPGLAQSVGGRGAWTVLINNVISLVVPSGRDRELLSWRVTSYEINKNPISVRGSNVLFVDPTWFSK